MAGGDRIDLSGIDANTAAGGDQAFVFGGTGTGRVSAVKSGGNTLMRCNIDKDAAFEFELLIEDGGVLAGAYKAPRLRPLTTTPLIHPDGVDPTVDPPNERTNDHGYLGYIHGKESRRPGRPQI